MFYRVLAAGPIIRGNGTLPHRLVLLAWYYDPDWRCSEIAKTSVHTQTFDPAELPSNGRFTSLSSGYYFVNDDMPGNASRLFARKVAANIANFGRDIDMDFVPGDYSTCSVGHAG